MIQTGARAPIPARRWMKGVAIATGAGVMVASVHLGAHNPSTLRRERASA